MDDDPLPRDELMAPYLHPYRHFVPGALRAAGAGRAAAGGGAFALAGLGGAVAADSVTLAVVAVLAAVLTLALLGMWTIQSAVAVRRICRRWDERSELGTVRMRRPHAGDAAPDVAHDQYAVTVEDDGSLAIWLYTPLAVTEVVPPGELLVPGRPCFSATEVERLPPAHDTVGAADQLADAQARTAELEAEAIEQAREALEAAASRRELERETASTVAALRDVTGQEDRP